MRVAVSDRAWVQAMLDVEAALANVEARLGMIPHEAAAEVEAHSDVSAFDIQEVGNQAVKSANPVIPLVRALRDAVSGAAAPYVHLGATSQDVLDSAMMLIARHAIDVLIDDLRQAADAAATLAERHRETVMPARTLMQQASVTSFGLKAARWLAAIDTAYEELQWVRTNDLAVQLGGAVGTLSAFQGKGIEVMEGLASELQLATPVVPWHTDRTPMLKIAMAVGLASGTAAKVALDLVLLGQTEVAEVRERPSADRGVSSALPQKQNPVDAIEILATVRGVMAQASVLAGALIQEHERAAGAWQAEWSALSTLFLHAGGATSRLAELLSSVEIDVDRMRKNVEASGGLLLAEQVTTALAERTDPAKARAMVEAAVRKTREGKVPFARILEEDHEIGRHLSGEQLSEALNPGKALGEASALIDRVLEQHRKVAGATK